MAIASKKIAIDLGSSYTRIMLPRKGVVLSQPTLIARDDVEEKIVAMGEDAIEMAGRSPDTISIVRPLKAGVIADYGAVTALLNAFVQKSVGRLQLKKPEAIISVSSSATSTEKRALIDAGKDAGLQNVHLIRGAVAASLGSALPITEARGNVIVDIGSGTTEIGVYSLGGEVASHARRIGGRAIDEAIARFMRREHGMAVGTDEIERIKTDFLDLGGDGTLSLSVHGRNTIQGLPKTTSIKLGHLKPYIETALERTVMAIRKVLEETPPDLIADVIKYGIVLSGGGANLEGLPSYLSKRLNVAVSVAQDPSLATIKGSNIALTHLEDYKRSLLA